MSRKIYGVTVGTTLSPAKFAKKGKLVKTINGVAPDENGDAALTANQVGAAPGGYGLGTAKDFTADQLDSLTKPGFYSSDNEMTIGGHTSSRWWMYVPAYGPGTTFATQRMHTFSSGEGYVLERHKINGVWKEWGWVNPPLELGKEYRTTETVNGKSVWTVNLDLGKFTAGGIIVATNITATAILRYSGVCNRFAIPAIWNNDLNNTYSIVASVYINDLTSKQVKISVGGGSNNVNNTVYIRIWYTKD